MYVDVKAAKQASKVSNNIYYLTKVFEKIPTGSHLLSFQHFSLGSAFRHMPAIFAHMCYRSKFYLG